MYFVIPRWLANAGVTFADWANVRILSGEQFDVRRIDVVTAIGGISGAGYYWYYAGWLGAIEALALYVACVALALVLRPLP